MGKRNFAAAEAKGGAYMEKHTRADLSAEELRYLCRIVQGSSNGIYNALTAAFYAGVGVGLKQNKRK